MQIHIATNDGLPIYLQIVNQIKYAVASGRLATGDELPPIRVLAERLLINPNTVARAYRELETAGIVEKRRTAGDVCLGSGIAAGPARTDQDSFGADRCPAGRGTADGRWI